MLSQDLSEVTLIFLNFETPPGYAAKCKDSRMWARENKNLSYIFDCFSFSSLKK